jgi:sugar lactone lactonase YvrE
MFLLHVANLAAPASCRDQCSREPNAAAVQSYSQTSTIDTLAGGGSVGDGQPASQARLNLPGGVTQAPNGDAVIVDFGNHRIRRIDSKTGIIRTIAGTGEAGYNGDNIPAVKARLARPEFAIFDSKGDLFIADSYNNRVRRVDHATGLISTVAGTGERGFSGDNGPATGARLHFPEGIALDADDNLFISDTVNRRIRRVDMRTGIIETYAGSGAVSVNPENTPAEKAGFERLARIAVDRHGDVYIADSPSHRILVIDGHSRLLRTFAGTGKPGFAGDGGPAFQAMLSFPEGLSIAPNQDIYFADVGNHRIRKIDAHTGIIQTLAGTGEKGFSGDGGPALAARLWSPGRVWVESNGDVLIADILNSRVRVVDRSGIIRTVAGAGDWGDGGLAINALLSVPGDVAFSAGKVFIADYGTRRIRCVDLATGIIRTVAGGGTQMGDKLPATQADLLLPEGIAVDAGRYLYIADNISNRVWRVDLQTGIMVRFAGGGAANPDDGDGVLATSVRLAQPSALAVGAGGIVYVAEFSKKKVREVDPTTGLMRTVKDENGPLQLAVTSMDADSNGLFMVTQGSNRLREFDLHRKRLFVLPEIEDLPKPLSEDSQLIDIAVHGHEAYLADPLAHRIVRLDMLTARAEVLAGSGVEGFGGDHGPANCADLFMPGGVAVSDDGREIYIADTKNHRIRRVRIADRNPAAASAYKPGETNP